MDSADLSKVNELFKRVGDTGQTDMRRRCIEVVKQAKAKVDGPFKDLLSEIARQMESLPIG